MRWSAFYSKSSRTGEAKIIQHSLHPWQEMRPHCNIQEHFQQCILGHVPLCTGCKNPGLHLLPDLDPLEEVQMVANATSHSFLPLPLLTSYEGRQKKVQQNVSKAVVLILTIYQNNLWNSTIPSPTPDQYKMRIPEDETTLIVLRSFPS